MVIEKLAIHGGPKAVTKDFPIYNAMGSQEVEAATAVIESGVLSGFLAGWSDKFNGGKNVQIFEEEWANYFEVKHAISVNSWTSGLVAMVGAIGISPGDEVIVPPWTMCATATAVVMWGGIPVFADIEPDLFCLDPESVRKNITSKTKAILTVDIFGQSSDIPALRKIADENDLFLLSDTAQAPGSKIGGKFTGTLSDIGGFSLNYHKHIHTGEGGVLVTNNDELALKLRLIRNHGEASVGDSGLEDITNIIGGNYRLGEIEAAIGRIQLQKLDACLDLRQKIVSVLCDGLSGLPGLQLPHTRDNCTHVFYTFPIILDPIVLGLDREKIVDALSAEGVKGIEGGYANVHLLPMFQNKIAMGHKGFPWSYNESRKDVNYSKGICPIAERYHDSIFLNLELAELSLDLDEIHMIADAFQKVWSNLAALKN
tara:strand:- start:6660 stop:7943 length:1284 start_codon:yes stop_codon:yes gene_type:complete